MPLLEDPKADVRLCAVHSLSCETCKDGPNPIDAVPLLLERIEREHDRKLRLHAEQGLDHCAAAGLVG